MITLPLVVRNTVAMIMLVTITNAHAELIFKDDLEQGKQSFWSALTSTTISSENPKDGSSSLRIRYPGVAIDKDGWAEARFDLGNYYERLSIRFDLYIPENYEHRDSEGVDNNKFFRLWSETYDDKEKIGASMYNQGNTGESNLGADYRKEENWGMSTGISSVSDFITMEDKGRWMSVVIYIKAATDAAPGEMRIYKNGSIHLQHTLDINYTPGTQGYRYGYLLGWSSSGYSQETIFYIDNVELHDNDIMSNAPNPPSQFQFQLVAN